jgi:hypothetical protein
MGLSELRTPWRKLFLTKDVLTGCRYTVELSSNRLRRLGPDASELLKLTSHSPELAQGANALSMEHLPGEQR